MLVSRRLVKYLPLTFTPTLTLTLALTWSLTRTKT